MTAEPRRGMEAIGELENGRFDGLYNRVADLLELRLEVVTGSAGHVDIYRIWRDGDSTTPYGGLVVNTAHIHHFLYGIAVGIQGDWTP